MNYNSVKSIISSAAFTGGLLFLSALAAFIWANVSPETYTWFWSEPHTLNIGTHMEKVLENGVEVDKVSYFMSISIRSLQLVVNDLLMVIFFFSVGVEIKRELIAGKLSSFKKAILPIGAALGGMIVPALIYYTFDHEGLASRGWGIPMATDIAFSLAVISLLSRRVPLSLKIFLMALAVADDLGAISVIAFFYTDHLNIQALLIVRAGVLLLFIANRAKVHGKGFYYIVGVVLVWSQFLESGVHATIAGILTGFAFPSNVGMSPSDYVDKAQKLLDKLKKHEDDKIIKGVPSEEVAHVYTKLKALTYKAENPMMAAEHSMAPYIALVIMPIFALANAGVILGDMSFMQAVGTPVAMGVGLGLLFGKPIGIFLVTFLFVKLGIGKLPDGVKWKQILGMGFIAGMGFTMSIFVTELAFRTNDLSLMQMASDYMNEAKLAILLASFVAAVCGYVFLMMCSGKKHGEEC